jgi:hypothetical protein
MKGKRQKRRNRHKPSKISIQTICSCWNRYSYPYFQMVSANGIDIVFKHIYRGKDEE